MNFDTYRKHKAELHVLRAPNSSVARATDIFRFRKCHIRILRAKTPLEVVFMCYTTLPESLEPFSTPYQRVVITYTVIKHADCKSLVN